MLHKAKKLEDAAAEHRRAIEMAEALAADFPAVLDYRQEVPTCHNNLGVVLADLGKLSEAEAEYRTALRYNERLV